MTSARASSLPPSAPRLRGCRNLTPYRVLQCDKMGPGRAYYDVVVVKGTFALAPGELHLAPEQAPIYLVDEYVDPEKPTRSSVARSGDLVVTKRATDVLVTGTARTAGRAPAREWQASVIVRGSDGARVASSLRVTGPRRFRHRTLGGWTLSDPEPTSEVPIRYELSYGGSYPDLDHAPSPGEPHRWRVYEANPAGVGHWDPRILDTAKTYAGPQWEDPASPVTAPGCGAPLAGFGPVARAWSSRRSLAGTYDDAWIERARAEAESGAPPDYPADFDARFFQCAHPKLIAPGHLRGDETLVLGGLCPGAARLETRLPGVELEADLFGPRNRVSTHPLPLDTVHVDLDAATVSLTWRMTVLQDFGIDHAVILEKERT